MHLLHFYVSCDARKWMNPVKPSVSLHKCDLITINYYYLIRLKSQKINKEYPVTQIT